MSTLATTQGVRSGEPERDRMTAFSPSPASNATLGSINGEFRTVQWSYRPFSPAGEPRESNPVVASLAPSELEAVLVALSAPGENAVDHAVDILARHEGALSELIKGPVGGDLWNNDCEYISALLRAAGRRGTAEDRSIVARALLSDNPAQVEAALSVIEAQEWSQFAPLVRSIAQMPGREWLRRLALDALGSMGEA